MKLFNRISLAVLATTITIQAHAAQPADGTWIMQMRICGDGSAPKDDFKPGRDQMRMWISGDLGILTTVIDKKSEVTVLEVNQGYKQMFDEEARDRILYYLNPDVITIFRSYSGTRGPCGSETLYTRFELELQAP